MKSHYSSIVWLIVLLCVINVIIQTCSEDSAEQGQTETPYPTPTPTPAVQELSLTILKFFNSPGPFPWGIVSDGTFLWNADMMKSTIYKLSTSGNIVTSFPAPGLSPTGLAWDGEYLWCANFERIYRLTTTGDIVSSFLLPDSDAYGLSGDLTWDGTYLWYISHDKVFQLSVTGYIVNSFRLDLEECPTGIAWSGDSRLWIAGGYEHSPLMFYLFTSDGIMIGKATSPIHQPFGCFCDGTDLWSCSSSATASNKNYIYKMAIESENSDSDLAIGLHLLFDI